MEQYSQALTHPEIIDWLNTSRYRVSEYAGERFEVFDTKSPIRNEERAVNSYSPSCQVANPPRTMRHHLVSLLYPLLAVSNLFIIWKCCCIITGSDVPIVVVISESMAPTFHRGDLLLLWNRDRTVRVGDVPLVWFPDRHLPMLHRAVQSHWVEDEMSGCGPVYVAAEPFFRISSALFSSQSNCALPGNTSSRKAITTRLMMFSSILEVEIPFCEAIFVESCVVTSLSWVG